MKNLLVVCLLLVGGVAHAQAWGQSASRPSHVTGDAAQQYPVGVAGYGAPGVLNSGVGSGNPMPVGGTWIPIASGTGVAGERTELPGYCGSTNTRVVTGVAGYDLELVLTYNVLTGSSPTVSAGFVDVDPTQPPQTRNVSTLVSATGGVVQYQQFSVASGNENYTSTLIVGELKKVRTHAVQVCWDLAATFSVPTWTYSLYLVEVPISYPVCNGAPSGTSTATTVTATTAASIALTEQACQWVSCTVDVNGYFGASGTATANATLIPARTILTFYDQDLADFNVYPSANGTCYVSSMSE